MSEGPREVEGVLLVRAGDQEAAAAKVAGLEAVGRFRLRHRPAQRIRDTYLDTGDGALGTARVAFRVRELDGSPLLTLKADPVRSGLAAERLELEAPWSAAALGMVLEELRRRGIELPEAREGVGAGEPLADLAGLGLRPTQIRDTTRGAVVGGVIEKEGPIHISNVMLVDPKGDRATRVGVVREDGKRVRVAKRSGTRIDD